MSVRVRIFVRSFSLFGALLRGRRVTPKRVVLQEACQDQVYSLNERREPTHAFETALRALRCYAVGSNEDELVELSLRLNMFIKKNSKRGAFRGTVLLPNPLGTVKRIVVIAEEELMDSARQAGADVVGGKELIQQLQEGSIKFDICLSSESMYDSLQPLQRTLKNKMPHPRRGTVTNDLVAAIERLKQEHEYNTDKEGNLNTVVGKLSFSDRSIGDNIKTLVQSLMAYRVPKGALIQSATLSSSEGPGYQIEFSPFLRNLQPESA